MVFNNKNWITTYQNSNWLSNNDKWSHKYWVIIFIMMQNMREHIYCICINIRLSLCILIFQMCVFFIYFIDDQYYIFGCQGFCLPNSIIIQFHNSATGEVLFQNVFISLFWCQFSTMCHLVFKCLWIWLSSWLYLAIEAHNQALGARQQICSALFINLIYK